MAINEKDEKLHEEHLQYLFDSGYNIVGQNYLGFDDKKEKIIWNNTSKNKENWESFEGNQDNLTRFNYKDLESYQIISEVKAITKNGVEEAIIGKFFLGDFGAIIGGLAGRGTETQIDKLGIEAKFINIDDPIYIQTFSDEIMTNDHAFEIQEKAVKKFQEIYLKYHKTKPNSKDNELAVKNLSDEISALKKLLDAGVITQVEFEKGKSKLLN